MSDEKQPVQYYDLKAARAHGISDEDILNQLAQTHNYDLAGAREHGVSDSDILSTLVATKPPAEPVTEKESPEIMGGIGATAGVLGAAGDVIYSKGRPLIRMAEKAMGKEPSTPLPKQRAFLDPSAVAEQAIERRTAPPIDATGSPSAVRNWGVSQHEGEFLGGKEYSEADKIKKEALAFEKANPGHKVMPGSLLAVPEHEARNVAQKRAELAAQEDALKQAEVQAVAQKRAERLGERSALKQQQTKYDVAKGTAGLLGKAVLPIMGGYQLGSQGAQAYNRLTRPDLTARDVLSGAANVVGAGTGALSMVPSKYRIPAAITSQAAGTLANMLDKRNPRDEIVEEKAAGGSVQHFDIGGSVNYSNPSAGGLSGLLAGNNPTAPTTPPAYTPMPATLAEYQVQRGNGPMAAVVDPWAGTTDASGAWVRNPDQNAAYAAYAAQQNATQGGQIPATPTTGGGLSGLLAGNNPTTPTVPAIINSTTSQLPSNWQQTYTGPSAAMVGWQPDIQQYAANNNAGFTLSTPAPKVNNIPVTPKPVPVPVAPKVNNIPVTPRPVPVSVAPVNTNQPIITKAPFINRGARPSILNPFNFRRR